MKFDFSTPILDADGNKMPKGDPGKEGTKQDHVVMGDIVFNSLSAELPTDKKDPEAKGKRFDLMMKTRSGIVDLQATEVADILKRIAETHGALVFGRIREFLDSPIPDKSKAN